MKVNKQISQANSLWHPNFRVVETLPDTKVIRTSFVINFVAVVLVLATGTFLVTREQEAAQLQAQAAEWDARIRESTPKYVQATKLQQEFSEAEKRLKEIEAFVTADFTASVFLRRLAETWPRYFTLDSLEMYGQGVRLKGSIAGPSSKATDIATAYVSQLKSDSLFSAQMQSVMLNSITRDQEELRMYFEIEMKLKPRN